VSDFDIDVSGLRESIRDVEGIADDFEDATPYVVGTGVQYAIYVEFGRGAITPTDADALRFRGSDGDVIFRQRVGPQDPQPFVRPAVAEAASNLQQFVARNTRTTLQQIDTADELTRVVALALERRIKELAPVDTGTLRASVTAVPGRDPAALPGEDDVDGGAQTSTEIDLED
jgi:hypothetical protein